MNSIWKDKNEIRNYISKQTEKKSDIPALNKILMDMCFDKFKDDKEFVYEAIEHFGISIYFASKELRNDKELGLLAVKNDSNELAYLSGELRNNPEVVLTAFNTAIKNHSIFSIYNIGDNLLNEIGDNDIEQYLQSKVLSNKLDEFLPSKEQDTPRKRLKL